MYLTENFEPRRVLERFEDICAIPHGSGHEQALGDWVMALAEKRGHEAIRDAAGNILVRVAASPGCEAAPPILLQGHLDMVLAQEEGLSRFIWCWRAASCGLTGQRWARTTPWVCATCWP